MSTVWTSWGQDVRYALRQMRRAPRFAVTAVLTLAMAIGVATAVFSVIDATIIRPLPYHDPDGIVSLDTFSPQGYHQPASWAQYQDWRRENRTLSALAGLEMGSANLDASGKASPVRAVYGTDNFFDVFQVKPLLGRTFAPGEDTDGRNDVAVLSYELWQGSLGGRNDVIGTTLKIDGVPNLVIGVMPAGFRYPLSMVNAVYRPIHLTKSRREQRGSHFLPTIARLKPGVMLPQAQGDFQHVLDSLGRAYPDEAGRRIAMQPLAKSLLGDTAAPLHVLTMAVFGVLLIGCINVAGLLLARGVRRQRELSLRTAVGASRMRVARQLLTESAFLSLLGGAAGVVLAFALLRILRQMLVTSLQRGAEIHLNLTVLMAALVTAVLSGLLAGALPVWQSARLAPALVLRSGGGAGSSRGQNLLRSGFIVAQVSITLGLLLCCGLLLRNLHGLRSADLGIRPEGLLTEELFVNAANHPGGDLVTGFYTPLLERVRSIPGVTGVGVISLLPIQSSGSNSDIQIVGKPPAPKNQELLAENRSVAPGTLEAMGAHLLRGRALDASMDKADAPLSAVVNQAFVRKFFTAGEDAVGRQIEWGPVKLPIVGVISDVRQSITQPPMAEMDLSIAQIPKEYAVDELQHMTLIVRSSVPATQIAGPLREAMRQTDPTVPFRTPLTMDQVIAETLTFERLESWLFGIFATLALAISLVGIYGMIHHEVELHTRDIGVRMALGSSRGRVLTGVLRRVAVLMVVGLGAGWALTFALQRVLASLVELHFARNADLLLGITAGLGVVGLLASLVPARRAAAVEPMQALRAE